MSSATLPITFSTLSMSDREVWISHPSRDILRRSILATTRLMTDGRLSGTAACYLIVGSRGSGKTRLLEMLRDDIEALGSGQTGRCNTVALLCSAADARETRLLDLMKHRVATLVKDGGRVRSAANVDEFNAALWEAFDPKAAQRELEAASKEGAALREEMWRARACAVPKVVVLVNDLELLFTADTPYEMCADWMRTLREIGDISGVRFTFAVVSGSAARLRSLVFCKAVRAEVADRFPNYNAAFSLNSGKYLPVYMNTQQWGVEAFRSTMVSLGAEVADAWDVMLETMGVLRNMASLAARPGVKVPIRIRTEGALYDRIFELSAAATSELQDEADDATALEAFTVLRSSLPEWKDSALYDLHDGGAIFLDDLTFPWTISIPSMAHLALHIRGKASLHPREALCLAVPHGKLGIDAEFSVARSLADELGVAAPTFPLPLLPRQDYEARRYERGKVYTERPDLYGCDLVFVPGDAGRKVVRVQVKLGGSPMPSYKLRKVADKLREGSGSDDAMMLVTTRALPADWEVITAGIVVYDRRAMATRWAQDIRDWAQRVRDTRYLVQEEEEEGRGK